MKIKYVFGGLCGKKSKTVFEKQARAGCSAAVKLVLLPSFLQ